MLKVNVQLFKFPETNLARTAKTILILRSHNPTFKEMSKENKVKEIRNQPRAQ